MRGPDVIVLEAIGSCSVIAVIPSLYKQVNKLCPYKRNSSFCISFMQVFFERIDGKQ